MNTKGLVLIFAVVAAFLIPASGFAVTTTAADGSISIRASEITGLGSSTLVLKGDAYIKTVDKATGSVFEASGAKISITFFSSGANRTSGVGAIKSAEIFSPVKVVYAMTESGNRTVTTATSDSATYDGATQLASFEGNVKVISDNPAMFSVPTVLTGDKATVSTKQNPGPQDLRFKIESTSGPARIEATPKPKAKDAGK